MKKLALGVLLAGFLVAGCSGDDGDDVPQNPDARQIDAGEGIDAPGSDIDGGTTEIDSGVVLVCNPLNAYGQQGCADGEKCTWITVQTDPDRIGKLGCVANGTVELGGACTTGAAGEATGFDTCTAGNYCIDGACRDICGFDNSANAACATGFNCTRYSDTFSNGDDDPIAGICKSSCDPLTQLVGGGPATCPSGEGCYVVATATTSYAVCASAQTLTHGQPITGPLFVNSCAPGHTFRRTAQGASTYECTALCKPANVTSTTNMAQESGVEPYTCVNAGASPPSSSTSGEYCQYFWAREGATDLTPYSNTLGSCFKHAIYQYDSNGDMTPDAPWPRCITLTTGDVLPPHGTPADPDNDALDFACIEYPAALQGAVKNARRWFSADAPMVDRLQSWH